MTNFFISITKDVELKKDGKGKFNKYNTKYLHLTQVLKK